MIICPTIFPMTTTFSIGTTQQKHKSNTLKAAGLFIKRVENHWGDRTRQRAIKVGKVRDQRLKKVGVVCKGPNLWRLYSKRKRKKKCLHTLTTPCLATKLTLWSKETREDQLLAWASLSSKRSIGRTSCLTSSATWLKLFQAFPWLKSCKKGQVERLTKID